MPSTRRVWLLWLVLLLAYFAVLGCRVETDNAKRNLAVFDLLDRNYEKVEAKASCSGLMKWLRIDYKTWLIHKKP